MICFLSLFCIRFGFENIKIDPGQSLLLDLYNQGGFIFMPLVQPDEIIFFFNKTVPIIVSNFIERNLYIENSIINITSNSAKQVEIPFWRVPLNLCDQNNFYITAEYSIHMHAMANPNNNICIFLNNEKSKVVLELDLPAKSTIYGEDMNIIENKFDLITNEPLLITTQVPNEKRKFDLKAIFTKSKHSFCHLKPIYSFYGIAGVPSEWPGQISDTKCINYEETTLHIRYLISFVLMIFAIYLIYKYQRQYKIYTARSDTQSLIQTGAPEGI